MHFRHPEERSDARISPAGHPEVTRRVIASPIAPAMGRGDLILLLAPQQSDPTGRCRKTNIKNLFIFLPSIFLLLPY
jgi:hypothetical protein